MHIPDGILSPAVLVTGGILSVGVLSVSVKKARTELEKKSIPVMGVMAAFIFAAQMINFPILGAQASGHLIGGALSAILFGFWPASLIMTVIVAIQAIIFQDGGISVLGINLLNMAIIAPASAVAVYHLLSKIRVPRSISIFIGAFVSVIVTAIACALELGLSDVVSYSQALKVLLAWHLFIGIGEGLITMSIMQFAWLSKFGKEKKGEA